MATFAGVAGMYALLEAGFLAAAQLLVYIGAISVLLIFAIMMTRRLMQTTESPFNSQALASLVAALFTFVILALAIVRFWGSDELGPALADAPLVAPGALENSVTALGVIFASPDAYVISFELISLLLLGALVGSIFIARSEDE
jgi:NADH-quinone oxidoreductase subunit J